jgi:serine/threonine-protein kinase
MLAKDHFPSPYQEQPMIGSRLGAWTIDRELGRGGMGTVWLAHRETRTGVQQSALKVLAPELAAEGGFRQRFQREIDILRQLDHPNIVRFLESNVEEDRCFFAMEFVDGPSLQRTLEERGRIPWPEVLAVALQVAPALKHAHDRGIIHRDLKPSNLLIGKDEGGRRKDEPETRSGSSFLLPPSSLGKVKLTDFGIASLFSSPHLTVTGGVVGTAEYLSPEQAAGKPVSPRSDLYSLGVVLYTLLTGRTPFEGEPLDLLHKHLYGRFDRPIRVLPDLPPDLDELICQLLEKDPSRRPADASILFRQLDSFQRKRERLEKGAKDRTEVYEAADKGEEPPGPATLMSKLMRRELEEENRGTLIQRLLNRPAVVVFLLLVCLGLLTWRFWPLGPETLFERGAALMASSNSADWERAWEEYLEPLNAKYPDHPHRAEVDAFRRRLDAVAEERQAARKADRAGPMSEAEWFYVQGLRLRQQGKEAEAKAVWERLIRAFKEVPGEGPWARLAEQRLKDGDAPPPREWKSVEKALERAKDLEAAGKEDEAKAIREALQQLYRDYPAAPTGGKKM